MPILGQSAHVDARGARIAKLKGDIAHALQTNFLHPAAAGDLRLGPVFYSSLIAGKLVRGTIRPIIRTQ